MRKYVETFKTLIPAGAAEPRRAGTHPTRGLARYFVPYIRSPASPRPGMM